MSTVSRPGIAVAAVFKAPGHSQHIHAVTTLTYGPRTAGERHTEAPATPRSAPNTSPCSKAPRVRISTHRNHERVYAPGIVLKMLKRTPVTPAPTCRDRASTS